MSNYNTIQVSYREKCKERIQRQLDISKLVIFSFQCRQNKRVMYVFFTSAGQSKSSEEVEDMLEKKNIALFTSGVFGNSLKFLLIYCFIVYCYGGYLDYH